MSKISDMQDFLKPARDEDGHPITQRQWDELCKQLAERDAELKRINHAINDPRVDLTITAAEAITELHQQVTLLRDSVLYVQSECDPPTWVDDVLDKALAATEPKP